MIPTSEEEGKSFEVVTFTPETEAIAPNLEDLSPSTWNYELKAIGENVASLYVTDGDGNRTIFKIRFASDGNFYGTFQAWSQSPSPPYSGDVYLNPQ
jgi:hypothetical protein